MARLQAGDNLPDESAETRTGSQGAGLARVKRAHVGYPDGSAGSGPSPRAEPENDAQEVEDEENNAVELMGRDALKCDGGAKDYERLESLCLGKIRSVGILAGRRGPSRGGAGTYDKDQECRCTSTKQRRGVGGEGQDDERQPQDGKLEEKKP